MESSFHTYEAHFNPQQYLQQYYSGSAPSTDDIALLGIMNRWLRSHQRVFERGLDLGCGPTLHYSFAFAPFCRSIELADFLPGNLEEIRKWIDGESAAHEWDPLLRGVLACEGSPADELATRKALHRARVVQLLPCNLLHDLPLGRSTGYDLVTSFFCAECIARSKSEWDTIIRRIAGLVNPGGALFIAAVGNASRYGVVGKWFEVVPVEEDDFVPILESSGFAPRTVQTWSIPAPDWVAEGFDHICLVGAVKKEESLR